MSGEEVPKKPATKVTDKEEKPSGSKQKSDENLPNHLKQQLNPIALTPSNEKRSRNFFSAFQKAGQDKLKEKQAKDREMGIVSPEIISKAEQKKNLIKSRMDLFKSNVHYQYKEGYTNAVRRKVLMKDLM